jgi:hypothetical protein
MNTTGQQNTETDISLKLKQPPVGSTLASVDNKIEVALNSYNTTGRGPRSSTGFLLNRNASEDKN